jgi:parallel beta-helix repeat protein
MNNYTTGTDNYFFYGLILPANLDSYWSGGLLRVSWSDIYTPDVSAEVWASENGTAPYELICTTVAGATGADLILDTSKTWWTKIRITKDGVYSGFSMPMRVTPDVPLVGYFVKTGGNDLLDGKSDANAWATLAKVQSSTFIPGDTIYFNRTNTFRGALNKNGLNGSSSNYITFSAYGAGAKPKIYGSKALDVAGDWINHAGNVWKTTATLGTNQNDISNVVMNAEAVIGVKKRFQVDLLAQGDFFYNTVDDLLYMYSVGNPGTFYADIEACGNYDLSQGLFYFINSSYITVSNLDFRYSSAAGIEFRASSNILIEKNDLSYIGGEFLDPAVNAVRLGNGISMVQNISNIEVRHNYVTQCYDAGISPQMWSASTQTDINIHHNIVTNCWYSYEFWASPYAVIRRIQFDNNTCFDAGNVWSATQRPDVANGRHVMSWALTGTAENCTIRNNIFDTCTNEAMRIDDNWNKLTMDYNIFNVASVGLINEITPLVTLANWRTGTGLDLHSQSANPLFVGGGDYHLQAGSPAINAGTATGYIYVEDFDGVVVGSPPCVGAYEF